MTVDFSSPYRERRMVEEGYQDLQIVTRALPGELTRVLNDIGDKELLGR
jgi:hypothetical protein